MKRLSTFVVAAVTLAMQITVIANGTVIARSASECGAKRSLPEGGEAISYVLNPKPIAAAGDAEGKLKEDLGTDTTKPGGAITLTGEELTPAQHAEVNAVIAQYFDSWTREGKTAQPLSAAELSALGAEGLLPEGAEVFVIPGLSQFDDILVAHPGRGGEAFNHTKKRIYISTARVETVRALSPNARAQFWQHESGHLTMEHGASEEAVQARYPTDLVLSEVAVQIVTATASLTRRENGNISAALADIEEAGLKDDGYAIVFSADAIFNAGLGAVLPSVIAGLGEGPVIPIVCVYRDETEKGILEKSLGHLVDDGRVYLISDKTLPAQIKYWKSANESQRIKYVGIEGKPVPAGVDNPIIIAQRIIEALGRAVGNATADIDKAVRDFAALCGKA